MKVKFILDFDGVLFNSAYEAYTVAQRAITGSADHRQDIEYETFLRYRSVVTDAWQYNRLYSKDRYVQPAALRLIEPVAEDWEFAERFFAARKEKSLVKNKRLTFRQHGAPLK